MRLNITKGRFIALIATPLAVLALLGGARIWAGRQQEDRFEQAKRLVREGDGCSEADSRLKEAGFPPEPSVGPYYYWLSEGFSMRDAIPQTSAIEVYFDCAQGKVTKLGIRRAHAAP